MKIFNSSSFSAKKEPKGFTLVELLVVISIIAILATISVTVFSAAQGNARDGKRRSEVSSLAKSIESSKDFTTGIYKYDTTSAGNDFPRGVPYQDSQSEDYCVATSASETAPPANIAGVDFTKTCAENDVDYKDLTASISTATTGNLGATTPDVKSWTICARLERSSTPFCASSLTK